MQHMHAAVKLYDSQYYALAQHEGAATGACLEVAVQPRNSWKTAWASGAPPVSCCRTGLSGAAGAAARDCATCWTCRPKQASEIAVRLHQGIIASLFSCRIAFWKLHRHSASGKPLHSRERAPGGQLGCVGAPQATAWL